MNQEGVFQQMNAHPITNEDLIAYAADELAGDEFFRVVMHVSNCVECTISVNRYRRIRSVLRSDDSVAPPRQTLARAFAIYSSYRPLARPISVSTIWRRRLTIASVPLAMAVFLFFCVSTILPAQYVPPNSPLYPARTVVEGFSETFSRVMGGLRTIITAPFNQAISKETSTPDQPAPSVEEQTPAIVGTAPSQPSVSPSQVRSPASQTNLPPAQTQTLAGQTMTAPAQASALPGQTQTPAGSVIPLPGQTPSQITLPTRSVVQTSPVPSQPAPPSTGQSQLTQPTSPPAQPTSPLAQSQTPQSITLPSPSHPAQPTSVPIPGQPTASLPALTAQARPPSPSPIRTAIALAATATPAILPATAMPVPIASATPGAPTSVSQALPTFTLVPTAVAIVPAATPLAAPTSAPTAEKPGIRIDDTGMVILIGIVLVVIGVAALDGLRKRARK